MIACAQPERASRLLETAGALLLVCVGGALGWFSHEALRPAPTPADALLAHMADAYALYGTGDYPVLFPPERANEFVTWIGRSFEREVLPPNLAELGYRYRGGRLLPNAGAQIGLFHFERPHHARLAVFFWTNAGTASVLPSLPERNGLAARFWNTDGLSFAVIGDRANGDFQAAADSVSSSTSRRSPRADATRQLSSDRQRITRACAPRSGRTVVLT
jgi:anti-sigma factor RsiW